MKKFRKLLARGGNPNLRDVEGRTPLYLAVKEGNPEVVEALVAAGANVRYRYEKGRTLLHICARKGDLSLARILLANGAQVNVADSRRRTPLAEAAYRKRMEMLELLLARGADGSIAADDWGTPYEICLRAPNVYEHADRQRYVEMASMLGGRGAGRGTPGCRCGAGGGPDGRGPAGPGLVRSYARTDGNSGRWK